MPGRGLALKMSADHPKGRMDEVFLKERVKKKRGRERERDKRGETRQERHGYSPNTENSGESGSQVREERYKRDTDATR